MKLRNDKRGFVLSGVVLLLMLPAMLLAISSFTIIAMGGETVAQQASSDKVFYAGKDAERILESLWQENRLGDNTDDTLRKLAENYRAATGLLIDLAPTWMLQEEVLGTTRVPGTKYCLVGGDALAGNWYYRFEELDKGMWILNEPDYDDPVLFVERLEGKLRITIENYSGTLLPNIKYADQYLWQNLTAGDKGENKEVDGTVQLRISIFIRDPRGASQYFSAVELG